MPDYGDDRGFRSRGVPANIGFDRMGGVDRMGGGYDRPFDRTVTTTDLMSGPPSNIGYDRAGPSRFGPPANIGFDRAGAGIFGGGGNRAYAANDIVDAIMGGMNQSQEGAGFDIAGGPGMVDKRMTDKLWGKAVNKFPPGTPDMIIQQEWERLKQIYFDKTYGGGQGLTAPSRDDIVGLG